MGWTRLSQQQQCGAQLRDRKRQARGAGEAPAEAVAGREVQDHDYADLQVSDGEPQRGIDYPATNPPERQGDITPSAPEPQVHWDDVVQPERHSRQSEAPGRPLRAQGQRLPEGQPLPEGK